MGLEPAPASSSAAVASVARLVAAAGLVEAFGHVSARREGAGFAITSTEPLGGANESSVLEVSGPQEAGERRARQPLEAPLHAAIYATRSDVGAIVRTHSPSVVAVGVGVEPLPVTHGLAGLAGEVAFFEASQLVADGALASAAVDALGAADCLVMRANGALATGADLAEATVRAWYLEERARVWLATGTAGLGEAELALRAEHWAAERERAWQWLRWRYGGEAP